MVIQLEYPGAAERPNEVSVDLSVGLPAAITLQRGPTESCRGCKAMRSDAWANRGGRAPRLADALAQCADPEQVERDPEKQGTRAGCAAASI